jgi:hypothetical protein
MKPTELRIGNLISDPKGQICKVFGIQEGLIGVLMINENWHYSPESVKPIPLTEEWLLKFGFEKTENGYFVKDGIILYPIRDLYFRGNLFIKADIKYVHQIQNLYFALIGEELTPKK